MLGVRVLGELSIVLDGRALEPPSSRRARSLLGLLAVERHQHSRSELAARFWPDVLDESARTSLRSALSAARKAIGQDADRYLIASRDNVGLAGGDLVWTDVAEFELLTRAGRLEDALELCRGELLQGLSDEWIYEARERHRDRMADALAQLAAGAEERGELEQAAAFTRRQVALDPLAEEPQRELIRRLAAAGDRPAALAVYRRLQDRLRSDLGIAPSPATRDLVESLRTGVVSEPRAAAPPRSGTVTLLFTDQVNSTETLRRLGDDEAERHRRTHFSLLRDVAARHGGQEVKNLGDGLMVAFGSAVDAVACAIGIQQAVHGYAQRRGAELLVRVGLNVGEPIIDEGDYFGTPVVVAKRLCDAAHGSQILASDVVCRLVGTRGGFEFRPLGSVSLKGIAEPVQMCEIGWEPTTVQRIPLPTAVIGTDGAEFVGRAAALDELRGHWAAVTGGERRVVLVGGEPGIGKTRLAAELCRDAYGGGATVLAGRCFEESLIPYQPFVEALRQYVADCPPAELTVQVSPRRRELAALVPELGGDARRPEDRSDAEHERFRLLDAVSSLVTDVALARPTLLMIDDVHWADGPSLLLLRHLIRATEGSRLLVIATYRKAELEQDGELRSVLTELRRARVLHELVLDGLPEAEVGALIAARGGEGVRDSLIRQVTERTDGNPLFIEELLRHVDDLGELDRPDMTLPDSIKELLLRRLHRLSVDCGRALAIGAVAGREFDLAVVGFVLDGSAEELAEQLEEAVRGSVLAEDAKAFGRYRFVHPLIRETIYGDMSRTRRALVHRRLGEAIESLHADGVEQYAGTLAYHYHAAGVVEKAFEYHRLAADEAERTSAPETAFEQLTGAIAAGDLLGLTAQSDATMRELYSRRAWIGQFAATNAVVHRDYALALEGARSARDRSLEMRVLNGLGIANHVSDSTASARYHEQSLQIADELGDTAGQVAALNRLSIVCSNMLDFERALELGERALTLARADGDERAESSAEDSLKLVALMLGDTERLDQLTARLIEIQRRRHDIWYLQWTLEESAFAQTVRGQWEDAERHLNEALAISRRIGDFTSRALILEAQCRLERARGRYRLALEAGEESVRISAHAQNRWLGWTAGTLAAVLADLRMWTEAREHLEAAAEVAERIDARAQLLPVLGALAWIRLRTADEVGARAAAERWDALIEVVRTPPGQAYLHAWQSYTNRARVALALGEVDRSEEILRPVVEPIERSDIREASADVRAVLAGCAVARGERAVAKALLTAGRRATDDTGLHASRLTIVIALARIAGSSGEAAAYVDAAHSLIDQIAGSLDDDERAGHFRRSVLAELETDEPRSLDVLSARGGSRHVTS